jgi:signal transduction histidine kinase
MINLEIRDNGIGMHEDKVSSGLGLVGMRERARALGGSFGISASPGNGMTISVHIPLPAEQEKGIDL